MIAQLCGRIVSTHPTCIVDVGGVGFELHITEKDRESIRPDDGTSRFFTYLYVREDRLNLFGFLRHQDRALFLKLIEVSGVGPKLAMGALSMHPWENIVAAISKGDIAFLKNLQGVGKKTAERICIELADKLEDLIGPPGVGSVMPASGLRDDVIMALTSLGMTRGAAEMALEKMNWRPDENSSVEEVVKEALRYATSR